MTDSHDGHRRFHAETFDQPLRYIARTGFIYERLRIVKYV